MFILPVITIVSLVFYIYYKVAILRTMDVLLQYYFNGRARMALGTFVLTAGINLYLFYQSKLALIVSLLFLILGTMQAIHGFKESRHYQKEYRRLHPEDE